MGDNIFKKELGLICDALADLAQEPKDPNPGWVPCVDKIRARLARADALDKAAALLLVCEVKDNPHALENLRKALMAYRSVV
jgi:hypothetical protein